jgi:hypothetical protein
VAGGSGTGRDRSDAASRGTGLGASGAEFGPSRRPYIFRFIAGCAFCPAQKLQVLGGEFGRLDAAPWQIFVKKIPYLNLFIFIYLRILSAFLMIIRSQKKLRPASERSFFA